MLGSAHATSNSLKGAFSEAFCGWDVGIDGQQGNSVTGNFTPVDATETCI